MKNQTLGGGKFRTWQRERKRENERGERERKSERECKVKFRFLCQETEKRVD